MSDKEFKLGDTVYPYVKTTRLHNGQTVFEGKPYKLNNQSGVDYCNRYPDLFKKADNEKRLHNLAVDACNKIQGDGYIDEEEFENMVEIIKDTFREEI